MSTPQPPRSSYRERRINVMLQDNGPPANPTPEPPAQQQLPPQPQPQRRQERKSNRSILIVSIAVTLLCAAVVFFLLSRHDATQSAPVARAVPQPVTPPAATSQAITPAPQSTASADASEPTAAEPTQAPVSKAPEPQRVRFQLKRSDRFQSFGPLKLRLVSTTPRKGLCQLVIATGDHSRSRSFSMNRTVQVQSENGTIVDLSVNGMTRDTVRGSVVAHVQPTAQ